MVVAQFSVLVIGGLQAGPRGARAADRQGEPRRGPLPGRPFLAGEAAGTIVGVIVSPARPAPDGRSWSGRCSCPARPPLCRTCCWAPARHCGRSWRARSRAGRLLRRVRCAVADDHAARGAAGMLSRVSSYDALGSLMFGPIGLMLAGPVASLARHPDGAAGLRGARRAVHTRRVAVSRGAQPTRSRSGRRERTQLTDVRVQTTISVTTTPAQLPATQMRMGTSDTPRPPGCRRCDRRGRSRRLPAACLGRSRRTWVARPWARPRS